MKIKWQERGVAKTVVHFGYHFFLSVLMVCLPYTFPLATPLDIISIYNQYINTHI